MRRLFIHQVGSSGLGGKLGDTIWAMAAAREWSRQVAAPVDVMVSPQVRHSSLAALLRRQSWVGDVFDYEHAGEQREAVVGHFGPAGQGDSSYPNFPQCPLPYYCALNAGIRMPEGRLEPWLEGEPIAGLPAGGFVAMAFNEMHREAKRRFVRELCRGDQESASVTLPHKRLTVRGTELRVVQVGWYSFPIAATVVQQAVAFVGDRSANYALAHAVGQRNVLVFEPEAARRSEVFGCPWQADRFVESGEEAGEILQKETKGTKGLAAGHQE